MILYRLSCTDGHEFDGWFPSAEGADASLSRRQVACVVCGSSEVAKALMAPAVRGDAGESRSAGAEGALDRPSTPLEQALATLRAQIEKNAEYVGLSFAAEARAIHEGEAPSRSIYGEAAPDDARKLLADGIPVAPLPFVPPRRVN